MFRWLRVLRRIRRQFARRWHSIVPVWRLFAWMKFDEERKNGEDNGGGRSSVPELCFFAALLAIPPFLLILFVTGMSDHLFELPFDQFRWPSNGSDLQEEVIRELLGLPNPNIRPIPIINPWSKIPAPLIEPSCKQNWLTRKRSVLVIVKSAPHRTEFRTAVRATYGYVKQSGSDTAAFRFRTVFVMGRSGDAETLEAEAAAHADLLVGNFEDTYMNNTLKFLYSVRFARHLCGSPSPVPFVLFLDDDYVMFPWNLAVELQKHVPNDRLYTGWRIDTGPFRFRSLKWAVPLDEYPFRTYPPYITAGAALLTGQTIAEFYAAIPRTPIFRFDDVYAGILAHLLAIHALHNANFVYERPSSPLAPLTTIAAHGFAPEEIRAEYAEAERQRAKAATGG